MKIAVIGKGRVGSAIGPVIAGAGHDVVYGLRAPGDPKHASDDGIAMLETGAAAAWADIIIPAIGFDGVDALLAEMGPITGKILIDPINPYDFANNLAPLIPADQSAARLLAAKTDARVVKALNHVGSPVMADAPHRAIKPLQFAASDDAEAKATVLRLLADMGFDARDAGGLDYARELEGMARLWIAQAFGHGMAPSTAWALVPADG